MRSTTAVRRVVLTIIGVFIVVTAAAATLNVAVGAAAAKPGITVQISPASQSVVRGSDATYTVTLTSTGGFDGAVALSVSGLPGVSTSNFDPKSLTLPGTGPNSTATSTLTVAIGASTSVGSYTFSVTGTSGKVTGSITAGLTVNNQLSSALSMTATPASVTLAPGETAAYTIQLVRTSLPGNLTLSVISGLPKGATATFLPEVTSGSTSTLQVATAETVRDDTYTLVLGASDGASAPTTATASVKLDINTKGKNFTIFGSVTGLAPGLTKPLELSLTNPNKKSISVTNLSVTLQGVTKVAGAPDMPCNLSDYAVIQYSGPYPLVVPGSLPKTLTELGVGDSQRPQIQFLNTSLNQDGCKGATLQLSYSGSAQGN